MAVSRPSLSPLGSQDPVDVLEEGDTEEITKGTLVPDMSLDALELEFELDRTMDPDEPEPVPIAEEEPEAPVEAGPAQPQPPPPQSAHQPDLVSLPMAVMALVLGGLWALLR